MISWEITFIYRPLRNDGIEGARQTFDEAPLKRGLAYRLAQVQDCGSARLGCEVPLWGSNCIHLIRHVEFPSDFLFFSFAMRGKLEQAAEFYG